MDKQEWATLFFLLFLLMPDGVAAELRLVQRPMEKGKIAFTYILAKRSDVYVLDFSSNSIAPLVSSPADDEYPVWSPDGQTLLFYSDSSGDRELYLVAADGSNLTRLTNSPGIDEDPFWSPDGRRIVFRSERTGQGSNLFVMNADGSDPQPLTTSSHKNTVPRWSPDGRQILYSSDAHFPGWDIMLYDFTTRSSRKLTEGLQTYCHASWSPDGLSFVYSAGFRHNIDLWLHAIADDQAKRVTERSGREYDAVFTGDGKKLFFVAELKKGEEDYQLFLLDLANGETTQVTAGEGAVRDPSWTER